MWRNFIISLKILLKCHIFFSNFHYKLTDTCLRLELPGSV